MYKKSFFISVLVCFLFVNGYSNDSTKLYNPSANVEKDIATLLVKAKKENKHIMIQVGGNWCIWCTRFHKLVNGDSVLKKEVEKNYLIYHLNYSKENTNTAYLEKLGFPQRFGFPVIIIMDANGNRLHTQDSSLLEAGSGYDKAKVLSFFLNWTPNALNKIYYKD